MVAGGKLLRTRLPHVEAHELPEVGHDLLSQGSKEVMCLVQRFLQA